MEQTTVQTESVVEDLTIIQLPDEVQAIALRVSDEKRSEVNLTLQQVFSGTADWKAQVDMIVVKDPSDKMGMNLAKTARLNAKNARLAAEKLFDQKRDEVQAQMLSYQTEDKLWLKAKQTMQILFKEVEAAAEYKEKTAERYENEQHELKIQTRLTRLASVNPEISRQEIELMSDVSFDAFLGGLVKAKEDAEKAAREELERQEAARKRQERNSERFKTLSGTGLVYNSLNENFKYDTLTYTLSELCEMEDADFDKTVLAITEQIAGIKAAEEKERERLADLARKQQEELDAERKKAEAERVRQAEELRKQQAQRDAERAKADAERKALEEKARAEAEKAAKEKAALEAELKARQQAEAQQEAQRIAKEKAEREAAAIAAKAPRKERLTNWVESFEITPFENDEVASDILAKFTGFKKWAKGQVEKI